jgi:tetratricopeptide (TPR) repeat protein
VQNGHARNEADEIGIKTFFKEALPANAAQLTGFYERLYLYQSYCWYAFIRQDFIMYYKYAQRWFDLFESNKEMIEIETGHYIKSMHILLNAHFDLRNFKKFDIILAHFEKFALSELPNKHDIFRVNSFVYINSAKLNNHLMQGTFKEGLQHVPALVKELKVLEIYLDQHRILVFNYKIATLYFGAGDYATSIDYLRRIINDHIDLRGDLQCYARLLHMIAHYELGNIELIESSLIKSVYRFMAKMENLTVIEEEMFAFLRGSFKDPSRKVTQALQEFLAKVKKYEKSRFETRAFAYLDVISWLESKVEHKTMSEIIYAKYLKSPHRE